jgi:hypothetical protein
MTEDEIEGTSRSWHGDVMSNSLTGPNLKEGRRHSSEAFKWIQSLREDTSSLVCARWEYHGSEKRTDQKTESRSHQMGFENKFGFSFLLFSFFHFPFRDTFSFLCVSFSLFFMHNNAGAPICVLYRSTAKKLEYFIKKREREFPPFFGRTPTHKFVAPSLLRSLKDSICCCIFSRLSYSLGAGRKEIPPKKSIREMWRIIYKMKLERKRLEEPCSAI